MSKNNNSLFQYLKKESIAIDQAEFEFQLQSHPDYGSLLAMSDTLNFLNIDNGAISVSSSEIDLLPTNFLTILKHQNNKPQLYFIEKRAELYYLEEDNKIKVLSKADLENRWHGVVLLAEKMEENSLVISQKNSWILPSVIFTLFLFILFQANTVFPVKLFTIFPVIGILLSIAALKDLFGAQSQLLNSFCNISASTSCNSVVGSDKWKIFEHIKFSDLSIVFFGTQFFSLLLALFSENLLPFFHIQEVLLIACTPVIVLSVYYQKVVEKKWCPICLAIISLILIESVYLFYLIPFEIDLTINSVTAYAFVFVSVFAIWSALNSLLMERKDLKEKKLKSNRLIRNYEVFKNTLISDSKLELSESSIILGNPESETEIAMITNPFCGHCKNAHKLMDKILLLQGENLKIKVLINADIDSETDERKLFFRSLMGIFLEKGQKAFQKALQDWYESTDLQKWNSLYALKTIDTKTIDAVYRQQNQWCIDNDSFQTPSIFINGYRYPKMYDRENLEFFVNELVEDEI
ncbi:MAG: vitamin K epoxide reductase family protein [Flavobacterium sp.]